MINSAGELTALVLDIGFLPFVANAIEGFSLEECTPSGRWFVRDVEGPWEWREAVADGGQIAYGKLLNKKAGFISPAWYPDFANWRRGGMDFAERYEQGLIPRMDKQIMDTLDDQGPMLSRDLKRMLGQKGFDTAITSLQMRTDITIQRLEYRRDAFGQAYGMGSTRFAKAETVFGDLLVRMRFSEPPEASLERLVAQVQGMFPEAAEKDILRLVR
mgnify:CR=1 FL=1